MYPSGQHFHRDGYTDKARHVSRSCGSDATVARKEGADYHRVFFEWFDSDTTYRLFIDGIPISTGTWANVAVGVNHTDILLWSDVVFGQIQVSGASPGTGYRTKIHDLWLRARPHRRDGGRTYPPALP